MRRREFITLVGAAAASLPRSARGQQSDGMRRIGVLIGYTEDDPETRSRLTALRAGLERRGWSEGRNIRMDYRFTAASEGQFQALAKELVALHPDVILGHTTPLVVALQRESRAIPIVFVNVSDPIEAGLISSLAKPQGNLTGVLHYEASIVGKWLAMLKEIAPDLKRIAVVQNPKTSSSDYFLRAAEAAGPSLAIQVVASPVENAAADIERVLEHLARLPNTGIVTPPDPTTIAHRNSIMTLAIRYRLPSISPFGFFVAAGGLISYGTDQVDMFRLAASYIDRILRGDRPADLPVQAPTKYETIINLRTAKALGLTVPAGLLVAADEVIE